MSDASMRHCLACGEPEYACECKSFVDDHDLVLLRVKHANLTKENASLRAMLKSICKAAVGSVPSQHEVDGGFSEESKKNLHHLYDTIETALRSRECYKALDDDA